MGPSGCISRRSAPAAKVRAPPVSTTARTPSSAAASASTAGDLGERLRAQGIAHLRDG